MHISVLRSPPYVVNNLGCFFMRLSYAELKKKISGIIPKDIDYEIDLEAGSISVITKPVSYTHLRAHET